MALLADPRWARVIIVALRRSPVPQFSMENLLTLHSVSMGFPRVWRKRSLTGSAERDKNDSPLLFSNLNFSIQSGERVAVTGRNGVGKTTLLKLLAGMLHPTNGELKLQGVPTWKLPRENFGLSLGTRLLYPDLTGFQNLAYTAALLGIEDKEIEAHAQQWGIQSIWLDNLVETYSMGQRSLLALARAAFGTPRLLLLDEPTAYLDAVHKKLVGKQLVKLPATVVYTTQEPVPDLPFDREIAL
ncbi:MAG: ABC transporter ATP-binding protein [Bdellovibrionota bacterium]